MALTWADLQASSFYNGEECTCHTNGIASPVGPYSSTCNSKGILTLSQRGWAPAVWDKGIYPHEKGDDGVDYDPTSEADNSPWIQTNVLPGNPVGRFEACKTPQKRCLCDGVYWYPGFLSPGTAMPDYKCYSWAFSITKIYSAQMRAGTYFVMNYEAASTAAKSLSRSLFAIGNGLMSHMQVWGQIQLMNKIMAKPFSDPTSWLHAMARAQYKKWDLMDEGFAACQSAGIAKRTDEQNKYFGAYVFGYMMPQYFGLSANIGASSADFFKNVVGYDHFNYNWGWRGEDPMNYGIGNATSLDFVRIHLFRAEEVYAEESRRMKLVCGNKAAKVTPSLLSVNEWVALRQAEAADGRRKLGDTGPGPKLDLHTRALQIQSVAPKMKLINAMQLAEATDPHREFKWEYGMPSDMGA